MRLIVTDKILYISNMLLFVTKKILYISNMLLFVTISCFLCIGYHSFILNYT